MTTEEKAANVARLARAVMNWVAERPERYWDPYASIADAMEMLSKLDWWDLEKRDLNPEVYCCQLEGSSVGTGPTPQEAICAACLECARAQGDP